MGLIRVLGCALLASACFALPASATTVRMNTVLGSFDIALLDDEVPKTVANFLDYVTDGDYDGSFVHRSARTLSDDPFVIQGGGFRFDGLTLEQVPTDPPILDEFMGRSNLRGTVAMARAGANTADSQWFVNLGDNSFLDSVDGGFTVFGNVIAGMDVVDAIAALPRIDVRDTFGPAFGEVPLSGVSGQITLEEFVGALVVVNSATVVPEPASALLLGGGLLALAVHRRCA